MEKMTISEYRKRYFPDKSIDFIITDDGSNVMLRITKVTGKGQVYFANKFLTGKE